MKNKSLSQQTADKIIHMIHDEKRFSPGDQLPNEIDFAEQLGVSRATLREAIRTLRSQGILDAHRGKGTFISANIQTYGDFGLNNLQHMNVRLKDLFETRLILEPEVSYIACRRATQEEIDHILQLGEIVRKLTEEGQDRAQADIALHQAIVKASHNEFLLHILPIIDQAITQTLATHLSHKTLAENTLRDHAMLLEFIRERDAIGAKQAMSIHLHHAITTLDLNIGEEPIF